MFVSNQLTRYFLSAIFFRFLSLRNFLNTWLFKKVFFLSDLFQIEPLKTKKLQTTETLRCDYYQHVEIIMYKSLGFSAKGTSKVIGTIG